MLFYFAQRWLFGPLIPSLMQAFGADRTTLGVVGSASLWGYMFIPIVAGLLSDRFGRKHAILFGIFGFSILTMVSGLTNSASQLFWSRFFTGTVEAFYFVPHCRLHPGAFPGKTRLFPGPPDLRLLSGLVRRPGRGGLAPRSHRHLAGRLPGHRVGRLGSSFSPVVVLARTRRPGTRTGVFFDRVILLPRNLLMLLFLGLVLTFQMASEFGFTMWFPVYLRTEVLMSATGAGLLAGFFGIGQALGRPIMGFVSDRVGYRLTGVAGSILMGVLFHACPVHGPSTLLRTFFTFAAGFIGAAATGGLWTFTGLVFASFKGLALGRHRDLCLLRVVALPDCHRLHRGSLLDCHGPLDGDRALRLRGRLCLYAHLRARTHPTGQRGGQAG